MCRWRQRLSHVREEQLASVEHWFPSSLGDERFGIASLDYMESLGIVK
jgi:hypothetical protein